MEGRHQGWDGKERRQGGGVQLHESSLQQIALYITADLKSRFTVPSELHKAHHDYVQELIECKKARADLYNKIAEKLLTGGAWALIGFLLLAVWESIKSHVKV